MNVTVRVDPASLAKLKAALEGKASAVLKAIARGTTKGALRVQAAARKRILNGPKTGAIYERGKVKHKASASGESPANDTGNLQRSISVVAAAPNLRSEAQVSVKAPYGEWLELGTKDGSILPRPFLEVSAKEKAKEISDDISKEIEGVIK